MRARNAVRLRADSRRLLEEFGHHVQARAFLAGDRYSLADAVWTVVLARTRQLRLDSHWSEATRAWYERMRARPSFRVADVWEDQRSTQLLPQMARSVAKHVFG